ncbi:hypothetical protein D0962_37405 [Leptolyngbyaceae cyanobacterium CCMR0082]|uniref:Uncharacterized protein n=1 Tax=Adonisia turfae CCMR0082 TaxID=2304604 RepID=A0A6M0SIC9_9CYAN|nr:hypothetical protein [Adonisia turfae]NEZ68340.1 hypothetical protein [Adonisia turfae CCMR0082]
MRSHPRYYIRPLRQVPSSILALVAIVCGVVALSVRLTSEQQVAQVTPFLGDVIDHGTYEPDSLGDFQREFRVEIATHD